MSPAGAASGNTTALSIYAFVLRAWLLISCCCLWHVSSFDLDSPNTPFGFIKEKVNELKSHLPRNVFSSRSQNEPSTYCTPQLLSRYPGGWPRTLDMGVYWFGRGDATAKAVNGDKSKFYEPARKTVIYFHGWTGSGDGWTRICKRATSRCSPEVCRDEVHPLLMERWLDDGWNVGFFYWDQFADEDCTRDAEQKIWFDRDGDGFHWKSHNVSSGLTTVQVYKTKSFSLADLCADHLESVMGSFSGSQVRFIGHSIGAQLAVRCAGVLHMRGLRAAPQRLTLLDPYFSKHHLWIFRCKKLKTGSGMGDFAAKATTQYVKRLWQKHGVVTEIYKSSAMTEHKMLGLVNEPLDAMSTFVKYKPNFCGSFGFGNFKIEMLNEVDIMHLTCRHMASVPLYFFSYGQPSPPVEPAMRVGNSQPGSALRNCTTPSASCSNGQLRQWVQRQLALEGRQHWVQTAGSYTLVTDDDTFELRPGLDEEADVDPGGAANSMILRAAKSDAEIYKEYHKLPWWQDVHSPEYRLVAVGALIAGLGFLVVAGLSSCRPARHLDKNISDKDSDSDGMEAQLVSTR